MHIPWIKGWATQSLVTIDLGLGRFSPGEIIWRRNVLICEYGGRDAI
jgi:hypothetical protein